MHQMVVSQVSFERSNLRIKAHQVIPDIGASHIYNALASYIRDLRSRITVMTHCIPPRVNRQSMISYPDSAGALAGFQNAT